MRDAAEVGGLEPARHVHADPDRLRARQRPVQLERGLERLAAQVLHHEVDAALVHADLDRVHHVRVIDRRERARHDELALHELGAAGRDRIQEADRERLPRHPVVADEQAAPELLREVVVADRAERPRRLEHERRVVSLRTLELRRDEARLAGGLADALR